MRAFIAIPLPAECRELFDRLQQALRTHRADVRWTPLPSIHLTLKFLGETAPERIPGLGRELRLEAGPTPSFRLRIKGLGAFPNLRNPRVIWCGLDGETDALDDLRRRVEAVCVRHGFAPEDRLFRPHLTLGRVTGKRNLQPLVDSIKMGSDLETRFGVDSLNLYQSTLKPQGAVYTVLEAIPLTRT